MNSFNGDKKVKLLIQKEIEWHAKQDKLAQGSYSNNGKFCAIGCAIESTNKKLGTSYDHKNHQALEDQFQIPRILWRLEDKIFEGLSQKDAMRWQLQFWKALPVGVDLEMVWPKFVVWLLGDEKDGVLQYAKTTKQKKAVQHVIDLYNTKIEGKNVNQKQWKEAASVAAADAASVAAAVTIAADSTDAYVAAYASVAAASVAAAVTIAADSTDASVAAYAADAAAAVAAYASASVAAYASAADSTDAYVDARKKYYKKMVHKLLELLKETK